VARLARVLAVGVPHHVTQRGNARRFILDCDADRMVYLNLLHQNIELHGGSVMRRRDHNCPVRWLLSAGKSIIEYGF
jgi:hypothetical protein